MHLIIPVVTSKGMNYREANQGPVLGKWVPVPASSAKEIEVKCSNYFGMEFFMDLRLETSIKNRPL